MLPNVRGLVGLSLAALIGLAAAQTTTTCDPTKKDCPEEPALGMSYDFNFSEQSNASTWDLSAGRATFEPDGVNLAMHGQKESPTKRWTSEVLEGSPPDTRGWGTSIVGTQAFEARNAPGRDAVTTLNLGLVRKKRRVSNVDGVPGEVPPELPAKTAEVNVLGAGMVRKKAKS